MWRISSAGKAGPAARLLADTEKSRMKRPTTTKKRMGGHKMTRHIRPILAALALLAAPVAAQTPPKAYVIAEITVTDPEAYKAYAAKAMVAAAKYGGVYLARGGQTVPAEGTPPAPRVVIMEFPSLAAARAFQFSSEEQEALTIRRRAATGRQFIVEGVPPPAP